MSLANRWDVKNFVEEVIFRISYYLDCRKDWYRYRIDDLFPVNEVGDSFARYQIFKVDK